MWIQSLSSFPREAIENAFSDYINYELDEFGRAWMPKIPQIRQRCADWCERNSGPPASDLNAEMTKWREEEKQNQQDPEWLKAYQGLKQHLKRLWPGSGGNESEIKSSCKPSDEESQKNSTTNG